VAYTPNVVGAAVISYDNNKRFRKFWNSKWSYLRSVRLPVSGTWLSGYGSDAGRRMLMPALNQALKDIDKHDQFQNPPASILNGESKTVPSCAGMGPASCRAALRAVGFGSYYDYRYDDDVPRGGLIGLTRTGSAPKGTEIGILISRGPEEKPEEEEEPSPSPTPRRPRR
jgi:hypothetical protein